MMGNKVSNHGVVVTCKNSTLYLVFLFYICSASTLPVPSAFIARSFSAVMPVNKE